MQYVTTSSQLVYALRVLALALYRLLRYSANPTTADEQ